MITDLIKNKEYKKYRVVTFIKDFCYSSTVMILAELMLLSIYTFGKWINVLDLFVANLNVVYTIIRVTCIACFFMSLICNRKSHEKELHKMK